MPSEDTSPTPQPIYVDKTFFLGRVEEQKQFRAALREVLAAPKGEDLPYILHLYGDGGMGKTTLAKRFRDIAKLEPPFEGEFQQLWIDWEEERKRSPALLAGREHVSPEAVFDLIHANAMKNPVWGKYFGVYQEALKKRGEADKLAAETLSMSGEREELTAVRGASTSLIAKVLRLALPIGDMGEQTAKAFLEAGVKVSAEQAAKVRASLEARLRARLDTQQYALFLNPNEQLARALAEGLKKIAASKPLILFLDTYEVVDRADLWLRDAMRAAGPNVVWVVGGRDNLVRSGQFGAEYFRGYSDDFPRRLIGIDMRQLALQDIRDLLGEYAPDRPLDEMSLQALSRATRGVPLALDEAAEMWAKGVPLADIVGEIDDATPRGQIVQKMTARYLLHVVAEADKQALFALALGQGDIEVLRAMLNPEEKTPFDLDELLHRLERDYASVHYEQARLYDEPALFFRTHLMEERHRTSERVKSLNQRAVATLRARLQKYEGDLPLLEERCEDEDWVKAALDLTEYLFWLEESEAWHWLIPRLVEGMAYARPLRQGLVKTATRWKAHLSKAGQKRLKVLSAADSFLPALEERAELVKELTRLAGLGWLKGEGEAERGAILAWQSGLLLVEQKKYSEALAAYEQAEQGLPAEGTALRTQLGEALYDLAGQLLWPQGVGDAVASAEAERILPKVVAWLPEKAGAWYRLGVALQNGEKWLEALTAHQQALTLDPDVAPHHNGLGNVYGTLGRHEEAIAAYQQATALDPKYAYPHNGLGNVYRTLGRYEEAMAAYQQALVLDPKYASPHNGLGNVYDDLGRYEEAIAAYQQALTLDPKFAYPHNGLGIVYGRLGRYEEAIAAYQQALALDPKDAYPHNGLGTVYLRLGRHEEAIAAYQQAVALDPKYRSPHHGLGNVYDTLGRHEEAIAAYQQALALDPKDATSHHGLGNVYGTLGRYEEAIAAFQQVLALDPKKVEIHGSLAGVYRKLQREEEAAAHLAMARAGMAQASEYNRACLEAICGEVAAALALLEIALQKEPGLRLHARRDPDFDFIRHDARFIALVGE